MKELPNNSNLVGFTNIFLKLFLRWITKWALWLSTFWAPFEANMTKESKCGRKRKWVKYNFDLLWPFIFDYYILKFLIWPFKFDSVFTLALPFIKD